MQQGERNVLYRWSDQIIAQLTGFKNRNVSGQYTFKEGK